VTDSAFRWLDAGIGAAAALGLALIVGGLRLSARRGETGLHPDEIRQEETR
jgi:hypothetical protein